MGRADDRKAADIVIEPRSGGQSIDHHDLLVGLPSIPLPIPFSGTVTSPELALYKRDRQSGIAKLAISAYVEKTGTLAASTGPDYGISEHTHKTVLLFFSWTDSDLLRKELETRTE